MVAASILSVSEAAFGARKIAPLSRIDASHGRPAWWESEMSNTYAAGFVDNK